MHDYKWLHEYCLNRFGSAAALEARLPQPRSTDELRAVADDRYLSLISLRIFRAGLKHSLVDAKWPAFEQASSVSIRKGGADGRRTHRAADAGRPVDPSSGQAQKRTAQCPVRAGRGQERGSFGNLLADWPSSDIVGLWRYLARHGSQLGGRRRRVCCAWPARTPSCPVMTW